MKQADLYYRPEWTCGRYNAEHKAALMYNLIEGMCFYYEDITAEVIGHILSVSRNSSFDLEWLSQQSDVQIDSLIPFLEQLKQYGLLTSKVLFEDEISAYRSNLKTKRQQQVLNNIDSLHEMTIVGTAGAERMFMEKVKGITSAMFELTYRCSEMCLHCYNPGAARNSKETSHRMHRQELELRDYKKLINELNDLGVTKVCLSGGDPFSKPIVWDIIEYLYQKEIAIDIFTNGISIVNQVDKLSKFYPRSIGISLYSDVPEIHDYITRVKGSHDRTINFIQQCSEYSLPMLLKCCIMKPNVSSYTTVKQVAYKYGALPQFDLNITDSVDGDKCATTHLRLNEKELEIVLRDKDLFYYISGEGVKGLVRNEDEIMCSAGHNSICITPEGNVQPCCAFPLKLGNCRESSISDILKDNSILIWWKKQKIKDCQDCNKHPYCAYCQMCVGNNYIAHGNPLIASENNCYLAKVRYNLAIKMQNGFDPLQGRNIEAALSELQYKFREINRIPSMSFREDARINGVSLNYSYDNKNDEQI